MIGGRTVGKIGGRKSRNITPVELGLDTRTDEEKAADSKRDKIIGAFMFVIIVVVIVAAAGGFNG